jgi:hypothetical protein
LPVAPLTRRSGAMNHAPTNIALSLLGINGFIISGLHHRCRGEIHFARRHQPPEILPIAPLTRRSGAMNHAPTSMANIERSERLLGSNNKNIRVPRGSRPPILSNLLSTFILYILAPTCLPKDKREKFFKYD